MSHYRRKKFQGIVKSNINETSLQFVMNKIREKFGNKLKFFTYIDNTDDIVLGQYIQYVDLLLETIRGGIVVKLWRDRRGKTVLITLKNSYRNFVWNIKPTKKYIFYRNRDIIVDDPLRNILGEILIHTNNSSIQDTNGVDTGCNNHT